MNYWTWFPISNFIRAFPSSFAPPFFKSMRHLFCYISYCWILSFIHSFHHSLIQFIRFEDLCRSHSRNKERSHPSRYFIVSSRFLSSQRTGRTSSCQHMSEAPFEVNSEGKPNTGQLLVCLVFGFLVAIFAVDLLFIYSFIHYRDLYSTPSWLLLRSALEPSTAKKDSFEVRIERIRTDSEEQTQHQDEPVPDRGAND